jgi:O-antigen/teichoic acid export membrane protein
MLEELRKLLKHTATFGVGNVLGKIVGFLMIPFYTHYLLPAEYGTLELLDLSVTVVGLILNVWITGPVLRYYYDYDEERERRQLVSTALIGAIVIAAGAALAGYLLAPQIASIVLKSRADFYYIRIVALSLFLSSVSAVGWSYLRARQESKLMVALDLITLVVSLSLNIYLIAYQGFGVGGMLMGSLMGSAVTVSYLAVRTFRDVHFSFNWRKFWILVAFGGPLFFNSMAAFVLNFSDRFFLQRFTDLSTVGIYALGYKFGYMLSFLVVQPFMIIWGARAYEIVAKQRGSEYFARIVEYYCLVLVAAALGISLTIRELVTILAAPQFHTAYRIVPLVAAAYIFQGLALYFQVALLVEKRSGFVGAIGIACTGVNLGLNLVLISRYAAMGAALATALTFAFQAVVTFAVSRTIYIAPYRLWRLLEPMAIAAAIYLLSNRLVVGNLVLSFTLRLALFLLFPGLLLLFRFFERQEIDGLRTISKSIFQRGRVRAAVASEV